MKPIVILVALALLAGCGVETATTAATVAAAKKKELEEGKKTMNQVRGNLDKAMQQVEQSKQATEDATK